MDPALKSFDTVHCGQTRSSLTFASCGAVLPVTRPTLGRFSCHVVVPLAAVVTQAGPAVVISLAAGSASHFGEFVLAPPGNLGGIPSTGSSLCQV